MVSGCVEFIQSSQISASELLTQCSADAQKQPGSCSKQVAVPLESDTDTDDEYWRAKFPGWNERNLETKGVRALEGKSYVLIIDRHPAMSVLKCNRNLIGCDIAIVPKIDDHWYKLSKGVLNVVCANLRARVGAFRSVS